MEIGVGTTIGGYRLDQLIGQGGMGVVYRGTNPQNGLTVAVKLLTPELARQTGFRERFAREARYANSLHHPNVIEVYDAGEQDGVLYIVMEYVEGTDLKGLMAREGTLDPGRAVRLLGQVASALDAAHAQGLLHRDIKPGNIMIAAAATPGEAEHCFLADFGLSKNVSSDSIALTAQGEFVGTIDYTAPELVLGKKFDSRLDIYSLGCLFYECVAGRPPFDKERDVEVLYAHIQDPPPKITAVRGDVPAALDDVLAKAMAKKPDDRYATASEFIDAARLVQGEPALAMAAAPAPVAVGGPGGPPPPPPPPGGGAPPPPPPGGPPPPPPGGPGAGGPPPPPPPPGGPGGPGAGPPPPPPPSGGAGPFPAPTLVLRVVAGPAMGEVIEVSGELQIGRQAPTEDGKLGNDIEISRRHARVGREADGRFTVEDLGSTNGTFVGGQRVFGPTALKPHDVIELGDTRLLVLHPAEAPSLSGGQPPAGAPGATTFSAVPEDLAGERAVESVAEPELAGEPGFADPEPAEPGAPGFADAEPATPVDTPGAAVAPGAEPAAAAPVEAEPVPEPDVAPPPEEAAPPLDAPPVEPTPAIGATPEPIPVVDATPEPTPVIDATPEPTPAIDATPEPMPVVDVTPEPTPVVEPTPAPAQPPPRPVGVRLGMDPTTGEVVVDVDDPDGPVRFVKRDGDWVIEKP